MDPRERAVDLVRQLLEIYSGGEAEADEDVDAKFNESLNELSGLLPDPAFNDLIRWPSQHPRLAHLDPAELPEKIVELAMEYRPSLWRGFTADHVRAALAAGGDPDERFGNIRNTPLHSVLWGQESSVESVRLLIEAGADVEALTSQAGRLCGSPCGTAIEKRQRRCSRQALIPGGSCLVSDQPDGLRSTGRWLTCLSTCLVRQS